MLLAGRTCLPITPMAAIDGLLASMSERVRVDFARAWAVIECSLLCGVISARCPSSTGICHLSEASDGSNVECAYHMGSEVACEA